MTHTLSFVATSLFAVVFLRDAFAQDGSGSGSGASCEAAPGCSIFSAETLSTDGSSYSLESKSFLVDASVTLTNVSVTGACFSVCDGGELTFEDSNLEMVTLMTSTMGTINIVSSTVRRYGDALQLSRYIVSSGTYGDNSFFDLESAEIVAEGTTDDGNSQAHAYLSSSPLIIVGEDSNLQVEDSSVGWSRIGDHNFWATDEDVSNIRNHPYEQASCLFVSAGANVSVLDSTVAFCEGTNVDSEEVGHTAIYVSENVTAYQMSNTHIYNNHQDGQTQYKSNFQSEDYVDLFNNSFGANIKPKMSADITLRFRGGL